MVCCTSRSKIKRAKRPCAYYCNSSATFHCPLEGDLVFKLNPGPMDDQQTIRSHCSLVGRSSLTTRTRNLSNLITINRAPLSMRTVNTSFRIIIIIIIIAAVGSSLFLTPFCFARVHSTQSFARYICL
jgi:hypothetical protein